MTDKRTWLALLIVLCYTSAARTQTVSDTQLIEAIKQGHAKLRANVRNATGQADYYNEAGSSDTDAAGRAASQRLAGTLKDPLNFTGLERYSGYRFARSVDSQRLELPSQEVTLSWLPQLEANAGNPLVTVRNPNEMFQFQTESSDRQLPSRLFICADGPWRKSIEMMVDFRLNDLDRLTSVWGIPVDKLFDSPNVKLEQSTIDGHRVTRISYPGGRELDARLEIVLAESHDYALQSYRMEFKVNDIHPTLIGFVQSRTLPDGQRVPHSVAEYKCCNPDGKGMRYLTRSITVLQFDSFAPPDPALFTVAGVTAGIPNFAVYDVAGNGHATKVLPPLWHRAMDSLRGTFNTEDFPVAYTALFSTVLLVLIGMLLLIRIRARRLSTKSA